MHGGSNPGAPTGNSNSRTHGLFSKSLGEYGRTVYESASSLDSIALAREAANFALAKIAESFNGDAEVKGAAALVDAYLLGLVEADQLSWDAYSSIKRRLAEPSIDQLGKALGPLKGLLELKRADATDPDDEDGPPERYVVVDPGA